MCVGAFLYLYSMETTIKNNPNHFFWLIAVIALILSINFLFGCRTQPIVKTETKETTNTTISTTIKDTIIKGDKITITQKKDSIKPTKITKGNTEAIIKVDEKGNITFDCLTKDQTIERQKEVIKELTEKLKERNTIYCTLEEAKAQVIKHYKRKAGSYIFILILVGIIFLLIKFRKLLGV